MANTELNRIERQILVRAPRERVWRALTDIDEFGQWFRVKSEDRFVPGARVHMVSTDRNYEGYSFYVFVEEMDPPRQFSWRWHPGLRDPDVDYYNESTTLVTFSLEEVEGGTLVKVTESGFNHISLVRRARVFQENNGGWEYQLQQIAQYAGPQA